MKPCARWFCNFCGGELHMAPDNRICPRCDDEPSAVQCGDEGRVCGDCEDMAREEAAAYFGLRQGMTREERQRQLLAMNPTPASSEKMNEWRKLK